MHHALLPATARTHCLYALLVRARISAACRARLPAPCTVVGFPAWLGVCLTGVTCCLRVHATAYGRLLRLFCWILPLDAFAARSIPHGAPALPHGLNGSFSPRTVFLRGTGVRCVALHRYASFLPLHCAATDAFLDLLHRCHCPGVRFYCYHYTYRSVLPGCVAARYLCG